jgi:hypothetical protein
MADTSDLRCRHPEERQEHDDDDEARERNGARDFDGGETARS